MKAKTKEKETTPVNYDVLAMSILINAAKEGRDRDYVMESMIQLAWRRWTWNVEKFSDELQKATASMEHLRVRYGFKDSKFLMELE